MAARDFAADDRGGNHLALAVFNQHDSHALADVVAGHIAENARAFGVERKVDRGLLGLRIASRLSVLEIFAGKNDLAAQEQRPAIARSEERRVGQECVSTGRSRWSPYH